MQHVNGAMETAFYKWGAEEKLLLYKKEEEKKTGITKEGEIIVFWEG